MIFITYFVTSFLLILKHESTSPEFVWGFQCSLLGSKIHYLGQEKSNSLHGSTQVVNIHSLGQIHNLGQKRSNTILGTRLSHGLILKNAPEAVPGASLHSEALSPECGREHQGTGDGLADSTCRSRA